MTFAFRSYRCGARPLPAPAPVRSGAPPARTAPGTRSARPSAGQAAQPRERTRPYAI